MKKLLKKIYELIREKFREQTSKRINGGVLLIEYMIIAAIFAAACVILIPKINEFIKVNVDILNNYDIKKIIDNQPQ